MKLKQIYRNLNKNSEFRNDIAVSYCPLCNNKVMNDCSSIHEFDINMRCKCGNKWIATIPAKLFSEENKINNDKIK